MTESKSAISTPASPYTRWRFAMRTAFLLLLLMIPFRLLGFNHHNGTFFLLSWTLPLGKLYIPLLLSIVVFVVLLVLSIKKGRIFCSWLCPMHTYLEWTNTDAIPKQVKRWLLGIALATLGMEVILSLFLSIPD